MVAGRVDFGTAVELGSEPRPEPLTSPEPPASRPGFRSNRRTALDLPKHGSAGILPIPLASCRRYGTQPDRGFAGSDAAVVSLFLLGAFMSEDLSTLSAEQRAALAADPATDPAILGELGKDWRLVTEVATNPSTPDETRRSIYVDFPHLRSKAAPSTNGSGAQAADAVVDDAIARFRARSEVQARRSDAIARQQGTSTFQVTDVTGRTVQVPAAQLVGRGTNGMAIASLVLSLVGGSLLAVVFGHVARAQIARTGEAGDGMASWGLALGYLQIASALIFVLFIRSQIG